MNAWAVYIEQLIAFDEGVDLQTQIWNARLADQIPDTVLFLEHKPVITLGNRGRDNFLQTTQEQLEKMGVDYRTASRGGDITYHGPGQLVMYPIIKLGTHEADAHGYLYNLEEIAIRTAGTFGIPGFRREGMSGAWTNQGKIAAIGFRLKKWITLHGMSFNVDPDLERFNLIVPCGLTNQPVVSLKSVLGETGPSVSDTRSIMKSHFEEVCQRELEVLSSVEELAKRLESCE